MFQSAFTPLSGFLWLHPFLFFFFNDTATTEIYTLSLHDALPILLASSSCILAVDGMGLLPPRMRGRLALRRDLQRLAAPPRPARPRGRVEVYTRAAPRQAQVERGPARPLGRPPPRGRDQGAPSRGEARPPPSREHAIDR